MTKPKPTTPETLTAREDTTHSGAFTFRDLVEEDPEDAADGLHRMVLTEGEQAVLWDILRYIHQRLRHETAWAKAHAQVDFRTLCEKADPTGVGLV